MSLHVIPVDDLIEHETTDGCPCGPEQQLVRRDGEPDRWMVVHHSLDGREQAERPSL